MEYGGCMGMSDGGEVFEGWSVIMRSFIEILFLAAPSLSPPAMIEASNSVSYVYDHVIDDVVAKVREEFANTGNQEDVLDALQRIWENKMIQCGTISRTIRPVRPVHDLIVPYEGPYETPTAEIMFLPTSQQTPAQTTFPVTVETLVSGMNGVELKHGRLNSYRNRFLHG